MTALHIVITDFNGYAQTRQCMTALKASAFQDFKVVLVDHGTTAETGLFLEQEFPHVMRVCGDPQMWWAAATNLGIEVALENGADAIMLLNNDCYVRPNTLSILSKLATENPGTIIAPIQHTLHTGIIKGFSPRTCFLLGFPTVGGPQRRTSAMESQDLLAVRLIGGGRGVIIPKEVIIKVGLLDCRELPHYYADHDFYIRSAAHGTPLYVATRAFVDIDESRTSTAASLGSMSFAEFMESLRNRRSHRNFRDAKALFRKHYPVKGLYLVGASLFVARYAAMYLLARVRGWLFRG